jgi:phosphatidylglycerophosphatase A
MWVALIPVLYFASNQDERIIYTCLAFIFFRIFDILKPFPISYFDKKYKNGFGIVFDDIIAGIISATFSTLIIVFLI